MDLFSRNFSKTKVYVAPSSEYIKKYRGKEKIPIYTDTMFEAMLNNEDRKEYTCYLISLLLNLDYNYVYNNIRFINNKLPREKVDTKKQVVDYLVQLGDLYINIELNGYATKSSIKRNLTYLFKLYHNSKSGEKYKFNNVIQISINNYAFKGINETIEKFDFRNDKHILTKEIKSYQIYLPNIHDKYYNDNGRLTTIERFMLVMCEKVKKAKEIAKGDDIMEKYIKDAVYASNSEDILENYDIEKDEEMLFNTILEEVGEEREIKGEEKGINKEKTNIAKEMLKDGVDIHKVAKYTGLSLAKVKMFL